MPPFFFQAEDGIRDDLVTGVQTCALPIWARAGSPASRTTRLSPVQRLTQVAEQVRRWMGEDPEPKEVVAEKVTEKVTATESVKQTEKVHRSLREEMRQRIEQHRQQRQQSRHSHGIGH